MKKIRIRPSLYEKGSNRHRQLSHLVALLQQGLDANDDEGFRSSLRALLEEVWPFSENVLLTPPRGAEVRP